MAAIRSCTSTCSGSTPTRRSTSWSCRPWAWSPRSSRPSPGRRSSATSSSPSRRWPSPPSARWSGRTTCSPSGMADVARVVFSFLTFLVAIPSAVKVFNWLATMYKGSIHLGPPLSVRLDVHLPVHDRRAHRADPGRAVDGHPPSRHSFIVAHFHYTMFGGTGVMFFGALHYWFPKMFGRMYNKTVAMVAARACSSSASTALLPAVHRRDAGHAAPLRRLPARVHDLSPALDRSAPGSWSRAILLMLGNLVHASSRASKAEDNPWGGATLEWPIAVAAADASIRRRSRIDAAGPTIIPIEVAE